MMRRKSVRIGEPSRPGALASSSASQARQLPAAPRALGEGGILLGPGKRLRIPVQGFGEAEGGGGMHPVEQARIDRRLYQAKSAGRDRICAAEA